MISHQHKCIFIHIPKCAGTSIEKALGHFDGHEGRGGQDHRSMSEIEQAFNPQGPHSLKDRFDKALGRGRFKTRAGINPNNRLTVTREQFEEYYKFTIVRNPWARAFSWYKNVMRSEKHWDRYNVRKDLSLNGFLREQAGRRSLRPQTWWLKSIDGSIKFDRIGRFEDLNEEFRMACEAMNLSGVELPHVVKGTGESYLAHYDEESHDIIASLCREEIEMFGFRFE